ncbi:aminopeptidase [Thermovibrio sp.]
MGIWDWKDENVGRALYKVLKQNLCLRKEDNLLILSDAFKERIGELFFWKATELGLSPVHHTYRPTERHGVEPPESVWVAAFGREFVEELKGKALFEKVLKKELSPQDVLEVKELLLETTSPSQIPTAIIAVNQFSLSHTFFRELLTNFLSARFASMPLFEPFMLYTSLQANWNLVATLSKKIASLLTEATSAHVTCPLGTDLKVSLQGREAHADTGKICSPGDFGNLPAGEAFIAPKEGESSGVFITKYAPDRELEEPTAFLVEDGKVKEVKGDKELSSFINSLIRREKGADNVAELGIGANEKAKVKTNVLEAEKILGTCHVAIGDNSTFGGEVKASVHLDFLIEEPTIELFFEGGKRFLLMEGGNLKV